MNTTENDYYYTKEIKVHYECKISRILKPCLLTNGYQRLFPRGKAASV
jgi:hypothetical protein